MKKPEAAFLVSALLAHYPGVRFDAGNAMAFEAGLAELEPGETKEAIESLVRTSEFMPVLAKVRSEVMRIRKARHEAAQAQQRRLPSGAGYPSALEWGRLLPSLLSDSERYERMTRRWCEAHGQKYPGDPAKEIIDLVAAGARGEDITGRIGRAAGIDGDQDEQERRHP